MRTYEQVIIYRDEGGFIARIVDVDDEYTSTIGFCGNDVYFESGGVIYKIPLDSIEEIYMTRES